VSDFVVALPALEWAEPVDMAFPVHTHSSTDVTDLTHYRRPVPLMNTAWDEIYFVDIRTSTVFILLRPRELGSGTM